ncbi:hypothetical protein GGG87_03975 [Streptococcus sp. zg-86]|uniref:Uncharacterized protein n=1 Tax=Streptococcus zhangguiae TaxID=2664091 RepID=A0A6I4RBR7_9STRE|nr:MULTISPECIES: hypothetical protein [unclassified Streptococcus]MTB64160.1 hypothetical protein [Streptococcus sp. zg-86]MTB90514.1 hypothetical protein [Streptococcus sp. zg-36]MWV56148.1 hypothetical protein [Streptococcus sp. zg-70]QTH48229.1 hypothetical protein J5M87_02545 [Streptococcus sp. zg-86]
MKQLRKDSVFLLLISFIYMGFPLLIPYISSDQLVQKSLYVNHILFYIPLVVFLACLIYGLMDGFKIRYAICVFVLFPLTILYWKEWIFLYQVIYSLLALLGNGLGYLVKQMYKEQ